jgi:hypothetical protein
MRNLLCIVLFLAVSALPSYAQESEPKPDHFMRGGFVVLTGLTVADIDLSRAAMNNGAREAMPVYRKLGPGMFGLVNGLANGAVGLATYKLHKKQPKAARLVLGALIVLKTAVVVHNYRVERRQRNR